MADGHIRRRERFILSCGLALGLGVTLVPQITTNNNLWPSYVNKGSTASIIQTSVMSILSSGFLLTALTTILLNLILPYDQAIVDENAVGMIAADGDNKQILSAPSSPLLPFRMEQCQRQVKGASSYCLCVPPSAVTADIMTSAALEGEEGGALEYPDRRNSSPNPTTICRHETV